MDLREFYTEDLFKEAYNKLQKAREKTTSHKRLITNILGPEVISDDVFREFLAFNYLYLLNFKNDGSYIMGEIGGIIPTSSQDNKQILVYSEPSINKICYGFYCLKEFQKTGDKNKINELEERTEMPLIEREGLTIINGNRNFAHYDFITSVGRRNELDSLESNPYLLWQAEGVIVISDKALSGENYIFNIPVNKSLFEELKSVEYKEIDKKVKILNQHKEEILPRDHISGFNIVYDGNLVRMRPIVFESVLKGLEDFLNQKGMVPVESKINRFGISGPYGINGEIESINQRIIN